VWGDTAVVTALLWIKGVAAGKSLDYKLWFSDRMSARRQAGDMFLDRRRCRCRKQPRSNFRKKQKPNTQSQIRQNQSLSKSNCSTQKVRELGMKVSFFRTPSELRKGLEKNHATARRRCQLATIKLCRKEDLRFHAILLRCESAQRENYSR